MLAASWLTSESSEGLKAAHLEAARAFCLGGPSKPVLMQQLTPQNPNPAQRKCGVEVVGLRAASRADATLLKEGEEAKQKSYRAVCRLSAAPAPELLAALNAFKVLG